MKKVLVFASAIALFAIGSCSKDKEDEEDPCAYDASQLTYNGLIKEIINTRCSSNGACHGTPNTNAGLEYTNYSQIKAKVDAGSFSNRVFVLQDMPQGSSLDACEMEKLKEWVNAGAPE
jgi:hypothetical protein